MLARDFMCSSSWRVSMRLFPRSEEPRSSFHPGVNPTIVTVRVVCVCARLETIETMA